MSLEAQIAKEEHAAGLCLELPEHQQRAREEFRRFVREEIAPHAGRWDEEEEIPRDLIDRLRQRGYLGAPLPEDVGGGGMDAVTYGLLTEELGRGCSSVRSLLTVHDMITLATLRWGTPHLRREVVPRLARAEVLGALALSEPNIGSDAKSVETVARREGEEYVIDGRKKWITYGEIADYFLVLAQLEGQPTAFLVPATAPGFSRRPIRGLMGTRASRVAELFLEGCRVPADHLVGRVGFGVSHVIFTALDHGRFSVAWGSVGIAQACLDACLDYTASRRQFDAFLREHQLVQRMLTEMIANTRAARLLCCRAAYLRQNGDPQAAMETQVAKYFASRAATAAAKDAVQLHGAYGTSREYPVARYLRDSMVMEIIEGSTQILQTAIANFPFQEL